MKQRLFEKVQTDVPSRVDEPFDAFKDLLTSGASFMAFLMSAAMFTDLLMSLAVFTALLTSAAAFTDFL